MGRASCALTSSSVQELTIWGIDAEKMHQYTDAVFSGEWTSHLIMNVTQYESGTWHWSLVRWCKSSGWMWGYGRDEKSKESYILQGWAHSKRYFLHESERVMVWRRKCVIERMLKTSNKINTEMHHRMKAVIAALTKYYCLLPSNT